MITDEQHRFGVASGSALSDKGPGHPHPGHVRHPHPPDPGPHPLRGPGRLRHRRAAPRAAEDRHLRRRRQLPAPAGSTTILRRSILARGGRPTSSAPWWRRARRVARRAARPRVSTPEKLQREVLPRHCAVGLLHGRMKPKEKEAVMAAFAARESAHPGLHHRHRGGGGRAQRRGDGGGKRRALRPEPAPPAPGPGGPGQPQVLLYPHLRRPGPRRPGSGCGSWPRPTTASRSPRRT